MVQVLAIAGSPSHPSRSSAVLDYAKGILDTERISTNILSVRDLPAEALLFAQFDHPEIKQATALVEQADALIIVTPVYKAAYTGVLKAFLDLLPQTGLAGKAILPIATGGTIAHLLTIDYAIKPVLSALGARDILGGIYIVDDQAKRQEDGSIQFSEEIQQRLQSSVQDLIASLRPTPVSASR
jgi:FMN reductase